MTRTIVVTSGKGGVGKTSLVSNLATALAELGQDVVAIDANLTTPNLGLHLGMQLAPRTLHDVLKGNSKLRNAIYPHQLGFKVIPSSMNINDLKDVDVGRMHEVTLNLLGQADYVLLDSAAGLGREAISAIDASDEILIITNPDLPSVVDALRVAKISKDSNKNVLGVVINRIKGNEHEMTKSEIEYMVGHPVVAEIPEDKNISESIGNKRPIVNLNPNSPASIEIRRLAHHLCEVPFFYESRQGFLTKLSRWMSK